MVVFALTVRAGITELVGRLEVLAAGTVGAFATVRPFGAKTYLAGFFS